MTITKQRQIHISAALLFSIFSSASYAEHSFGLMYGNKTLSERDWQPLEEQSGFGFIATAQPADWPLAIVTSYFRSETSESLTDYGIPFRFSGETTELGIGIRKYLNDHRLRLFVEGGLMSISAKLSLQSPYGSVSRSSSASGNWLGIGAEAMTSEQISLGLLFRESDARASIAGVEGEIGGKQLLMFVSYYWQ